MSAEEVVIASVSGGKDSTAMCLHFIEQGIQFRPVFIDTGWESASTYEYLRGYLPGVIGPIEWIRSEVELSEELEPLALAFEERLGHYSAMVRWCLHKAMFPSRLRRWCTDHTKTKPMRAYLQGLDDEPINAVGVRAGESAARAKLTEREWSDFYDCEIWRPIHSWTEQEVIDIHTRHGIRPSPNYLVGATRVGCWPCIYAAKKEIHLIAETDPERIELIQDLEATISMLAGGKLRGWFVNKEDKPDPETGKRDGSPWPIARVVEWARTKRGGRQVELFMAPGRESGCMRWGLCDTGSDYENQ